jgi:hypothetical protein
MEVSMNKRKAVLIRGLKGLAAVALGFVAAYIVGPNVLDVVPTEYQFLVTGIVAPSLLALQKALTWEE